MKYPTIEEVKKADREQLARWYRFLGSPGLNYIDNKKLFEIKMEEERVVMDLIAQRFREFGGFTSELSKKIGWIKK